MNWSSPRRTYDAVEDRQQLLCHSDSGQAFYNQFAAAGVTARELRSRAHQQPLGAIPSTPSRSSRAHADEDSEADDRLEPWYRIRSAEQDEKRLARCGTARLTTTAGLAVFRRHLNCAYRRDHCVYPAEGASRG